MNVNYQIYRMNAKMQGSALTQEEIKQWIYSNVFISKMGIVKSFNHESQDGIVTIPEY
ncbi:DUF777 family protein, partial [Borrelia persica]|uniref:DUF777 family protein n=1 Tax=Borrelia persica TaxID=44448 RepID=UPI0012697CBF